MKRREVELKELEQRLIKQELEHMQRELESMKETNTTKTTVDIGQLPKQIEDTQKLVKEHYNLRSQLSSIEKRLRESAKQIDDKKELVAVQVS